MTVCGSTLPTWALKQVGSYMGNTGPDADTLRTAALDPNRTSPRKNQPDCGRSLPAWSDFVRCQEIKYRYCSSQGISFDHCVCDGELWAILRQHGTQELLTEVTVGARLNSSHEEDHNGPAIIGLDKIGPAADLRCDATVVPIIDALRCMSQESSQPVIRVFFLRFQPT